MLDCCIPHQRLLKIDHILQFCLTGSLLARTARIVCQQLSMWAMLLLQMFWHSVVGVSVCLSVHLCAGHTVTELCGAALQRAAFCLNVPLGTEILSLQAYRHTRHHRSSTIASSAFRAILVPAVIQYSTPVHDRTRRSTVSRRKNRLGLENREASTLI